MLAAVAQLLIRTPEDVDLELALAGVASRLAAGVIDVCLFALIAMLAVTGLAAAGAIGIQLRDLFDVERLASLAPATIALLLTSLWFAHFAWFFAFEWLAHGQTLGKRWLGLRVVREGGHRLTATAAMVRSLLRLADFLPFFYVTGMVSIAVSEKRRRLGDFAAGTLVVRHAEPAEIPEQVFAEQRWSQLEHRRYALTQDHLQKLDAGLIDTLESYFERAENMSPAAKAKLTEGLAIRLATQAGIERQDGGDEDLLKELLLALREYANP